MLMNTSSTGKTTNALMSMVEKMRKADKSLPGVDTMETTRDGKFCILTKQRKFHLKDSMKNSDSMSTDHSILFQDYQCTELLNAMEPTISGSGGGERTLQHNNTSSIQSPRPSDHNNGRTMPWKSNQMVDQPTSE